MTVHIEIQGRPWCCYYDQKLFHDLFHAFNMEQIKIPPICAYETREQALEESVEVLKRFGVIATVVEGQCPEYGKSYEED